MLVAVYGTLKKGFGNHRMLRSSEFVADGRTSPEFRMFVCGIPYVQRSKYGYPITVEVYDVSDATLYGLDCLEGHPKWYRREVVDVHTDKGVIQAEMYLNEESSGLREVTSGCFTS